MFNDKVKEREKIHFSCFWNFHAGPIGKELYPHEGPYFR
jgi:hypothetical protein